MEYILLSAGFLSIIVFSFFTIKIVVQKLNFASRSNVLYWFFSLVNAAIIFFIYISSAPIAFMHFIILVLFLLEFLYLSKFKIRQSIFMSSTLLLTIITNNFLVLTIASAITNKTFYECYQDTTVFPLTIVITNVILISVAYLTQGMVDNKKLQDLASAKFYSDLMSVVSVYLIFVVSFDLNFLYNYKLTPYFALATIATIIFVSTMFYCLLYFNMSLIKLHPFKRKADEVKTLHQNIVRKKIETEFKLYSDYLTKLYNRRFIFSKLDALCEDELAKFGVVFVALASLKFVNDNFGHKEGDKYIIEIANILKKSIRDNDLSARIGGDEFLLVLLDVTDTELEVVIRRIKNSVNKFNESKPYVFHANLGYMCFDMEDKKQSRTEMLNYVDELMNVDKELFYKKGGA